MATFTSTVSYSVNGSVIDLADNDFRIIEQNDVLGQWGTVDITDMYPSANFTFGFTLTATEDPESVIIPFVISFYDTETRLKFVFNTNATETAFSVVMENTVEDVLQTYTLFSGTKPSLYPASSTKILFRLLNGFLWVKVGSTFWIEKLDIQAHPLHLEGGIIQFSLTNSTVLVSHRIQAIYFEPILCIQDQAYFAKSLLAESHEEVNAIEYFKNGQIYSLNPDDLVVNYPIGLLLCDYHGNTYNSDKDWKKCGEIVNRADYKRLANEIGIPVSQTTFKIPCPRLKQEWIEDAPLWLKNGNDAYYTAGSVGIGTTKPITPLDVNGSIFTRRSIQIGDDIAPSLYVEGGNLQNLPFVIATGKVLPSGVCAWFYGGGNIGKNGIAWTVSGITSFGIQSIRELPLLDRTAFIENLYPNTTETIEHLTIQHTTGNVGIGTISPTEKLEVIGNIKANQATLDNVLLNQTSIPASAGEIRYLGANGFFMGIPSHNFNVSLHSFYLLQSNRTMTNTTTVQNIFDKNPVFYAGYTYYFKISFTKARTASSGTPNLHTINVGFAGTSTSSGTRWTSTSNRSTTGFNVGINYQGGRGEFSIGTTVSGLTEYTICIIEGTTQITNTGTFIPTLRYSNTPVSAPAGYSDTLNIYSFFQYQVLGSTPVSDVGGEWV